MGNGSSQEELDKVRFFSLPRLSSSLIRCPIYCVQMHGRFYSSLHCTDLDVTVNDENVVISDSDPEKLLWPYVDIDI